MVKNLWKEKFPRSPVENPGLDQSPLLGEEQKYIYQKLVGMEEWMSQIGIFDIRYAVTSLNRFIVYQRGVHLNRLVKIFSYLKPTIGKRKIIFIYP